jgi:hypothetical protein
MTCSHRYILLCRDVDGCLRLLALGVTILLLLLLLIHVYMFASQCTDDSNYVGDYRRGKRHGYGVYSFPNGDQYLGEYEDDIPQVRGLL